MAFSVVVFKIDPVVGIMTPALAKPSATVLASRMMCLKVIFVGYLRKTSIALDKIFIHHGTELWSLAQFMALEESLSTSR